jgi:DNA-binding transcriptional regulator YiaG
MKVSPKALRSWCTTGIPARRHEELQRLLADAPSTPVDVRSVRERLGLTQAELGAQLGVSWRSVARWEAGSAPAWAQDRLRELAADAPDPVRSVRERLGLTQAELAQELGVSLSLVNAWETGRRSMPHGRVEELRTLKANGRLAPAPEWIRARRLELGLSYRDLAAQVGAPASHVVDWIKGRRAVPVGRYGAIRQVLRERGQHTFDDRVLELVHSEPGLSRPQLLSRFPARRRDAVSGALDRQVRSRRLFRAEGTVETAGRPLRVWRYYPCPVESERLGSSMTGAWLRRQMAKRKLTPQALAPALGVSQGAVRYWLRRADQQLPGARQADIVRVVAGLPAAHPPGPSALPNLRARRKEVGLTQAALAARVGVSQSRVSAWEREEVAVSEAEASQLLAVLAVAKEEQVTPELLRSWRRGAGWTQAEAAANLGVGYRRFAAWELALYPVPCDLWAHIRSVFESASPGRPEPMLDLKSRRAERGWSQQKLARRAGVSQSAVSNWEKGAPVPARMRERLERALAAAS